VSGSPTRAFGLAALLAANQPDAALVKTYVIVAADLGRFEEARETRAGG